MMSASGKPRTPQGVRNSLRWQEVRAKKLHRTPICEDPFGDHAMFNQPAEAAREVHHIERIEDAPRNSFRMSNLAGLCPRCHARISGMERGGRIREAVDLFTDKNKKKNKAWRDQRT